MSFSNVFRYKVVSEFGFFLNQIKICKQIYLQYEFPIAILENKRNNEKLAVIISNRSKE